MQGRKSNHLKMIDEQGKLRLGIRACSSNSGADSSLTFPHYIANLDPQHLMAVPWSSSDSTRRSSVRRGIPVLLTTLCVLMHSLM